MIDGHFVPGNVAVSVHQMATNRSKLNWTDPDEFVPSRWLGEDERYKDDKRDSMEPFSLGPRNCIGKVSLCLFLLTIPFCVRVGKYTNKC